MEVGIRRCRLSPETWCGTCARGSSRRRRSPTTFPRRCRCRRVVLSECVRSGRSTAVDHFLHSHAQPRPDPRLLPGRGDAEPRALQHRLRGGDHQRRHGQIFQTCSGGGTSGGSTDYIGWEENENPKLRHYHAEVYHVGSGRVVAKSPELTVDVLQRFFSVDLSFDSPVQAFYGTSWRATATVSPSIEWSPYYIRIRNSQGAVIASCGQWAKTTCTASVGDGYYYATVEDPGGTVFGQSASWSLTADGPREETLDDLDLLEIASLFAGPSAVCQTLLHYQGTHLANSSLSDQYLACVTALLEGKRMVDLLRAVAAAGGGTAVLWYLLEQGTLEQAASDSGSGESGQEPKPVPPIAWPTDLEADVDRMVAQNPEIESRERARTVLKTCRRLVAFAALSKEKCVELPIFASGDLDVPQPTRHDREAILRRPQWVLLNYAAGPDRHPEGWYSSLPPEDNPCYGVTSPTVHCDEYLFRSTTQGGGPGASLKPLDGRQNSVQGSKLGRFYRKCGLDTTGESFLSIPVPPRSRIATQIICNGHG